ncbi:MAG: hypothetical protein R2720_06205 [Candidatus Nanopelagicales bacterium]
MSYEVELARTAERLRQLSEARLRAREQAFAELLSVMTDRPVPRLHPRAWADQMTVIGREVVGQDQPAVSERLITFRRSFDLFP